MIFSQNQIHEEQKKLYKQALRIKTLSHLSAVFSSECRLEIITVLLRHEHVSSWDLARLTNCTPSMVSQSLAKMKAARLIDSLRDGNVVYYYLDRSDPTIAIILEFLHSQLYNP